MSFIRRAINFVKFTRRSYPLDLIIWRLMIHRSYRTIHHVTTCSEKQPVFGQWIRKRLFNFSNRPIKSPHFISNQWLRLLLLPYFAVLDSPQVLRFADIESKQKPKWRIQEFLKECWSSSSILTLERGEGVAGGGGGGGVVYYTPPYRKEREKDKRKPGKKKEKGSRSIRDKYIV